MDWVPLGQGSVPAPGSHHDQGMGSHRVHPGLLLQPSSGVAISAQREGVGKAGTMIDLKSTDVSFNQWYLMHLYVYRAP